MNHPALLASLLCGAFLIGCSDDSNPSGGNASPDPISTGSQGLSASGRIEAALVGTWLENPKKFFNPETLIFSDARFKTPYLSGTGSLFTAKSGIVSGGPDSKIVGEYLRSDDTLWFDGLLGSSPDGVSKTTSRRYVKLAP